MSTYYDYTVFYKDKETGVIHHVPDLKGSFNKTLLSGWELDPLIEEADLDDEWEKIKNNDLEFASIYFKGWYTKESLKGFKLAFAPSPAQARNFPKDAEDKAVINEDNWDDSKFEEAKPGEGVAICLVRNKTYKRGWWLDVSSLNKYIERHYKLLKEDILKKERWEKMSQSLDYLKLSDKEKDRVRESMDADWLLDDEDIWDPDENYNFYALSVALELKGVMLAFTNYDTEVKLFIYNLDDAEPVNE